MADPLSALLDGYKYETLLHIAEFNGITTAATKGRKLSKEAVIKALREQLFTPERATQTVGHLSSLERTVLDRLLLHGGEVTTNVLRNELQREDIVQPGRSPRGSTRLYEGDPFNPEANSFEDVIARLTLHGLVFSSGMPSHWMLGIKLGFSPGSLLTVPEPLRGYLPQPALPSMEWGYGNLPAPAQETNTATAQRELFIYWSYVRAQPVPLTQGGLVQKRLLRSINEQLLSPDHSLASAANESESPRLHFTRLLLQGLGLLVREHSQLQATGPRSQVPEFWKQSVEERTKACLQAWLHLKDWNELASLKMSVFAFDLPQARAVLLDQLRLLPPGQWISSERFLNHLSIIAPRLLFQAKNSSYSETRYYQDTDYLARQRQWVANLEGAFVGGALSGPLHWLGLLDISADESRLLAFRVNASGASALDMQPPKVHEPAGVSDGEAKLIVQPNFEVLALGPVSEAILAKLEMFASRVKADRSAFEYVLTRDTVYRGQKDGLSVPEIVTFLEQTSSVAIPQNVLRTLYEWGEQHERIVFHHPVTVCQTAAPELLEQLWADTAIQTHLERRLTSTVALVKGGHVAALQEALLQQGMLLAFSPQDDSCAGRVQATPQGELRPVHVGPDLRLEACLRGLAEEQDSRFYITEAAVTRALARGMSVPEYLNRLASLHRGPVPAALQSRIKAWGRYYGKASLQKALLLEVKDAATADELLADPELAPLLSRFPADPRGRLLLVHSDDLERVRHLLRERGVEVT